MNYTAARAGTLRGCGHDGIVTGFDAYVRKRCQCSPRCSRKVTIRLSYEHESDCPEGLDVDLMHLDLAVGVESVGRRASSDRVPDCLQKAIRYQVSFEISGALALPINN
jgi:hypothetical protein